MDILNIMYPKNSTEKEKQTNVHTTCNGYQSYAWYRQLCSVCDLFLIEKIKHSIE